MDFQALGFSRVTRLLPCLLEDLTQVMDDPRHVGQPELCVQLKNSILRYLPEPGEQPLQSEPEPVGNLDQDLPEILALLKGSLPRAAGSPWPPSFRCWPSTTSGPGATASRAPTCWTGWASPMKR